MDSETQLNELCERLETTPILDQEEARAMNRRAFAKAFKTWKLGQTYGEAMGGLAILNQDEESFRSELKSIDHDLSRQISIVNEALDSWFGKGETPPPPELFDPQAATRAMSGKAAINLFTIFDSAEARIAPSA